MPSRRMLAPVAVAVAIAGGGVAGAMIGVPGISGAQEAPDTTEAPRPHDGFRLGRGPGLDAAANALGMELDDLVAALREGQTIADVAAARGVDVADVIDAMVADVLERWPGADEARVRERITDFVDEGGKFGRLDGPRRHGPGFRLGVGGPGLDAAANALGMELDDLVAALRDGKTIAEIAQERGVDVDAVIDAMVADVRERIEMFVREGPRRAPARDGDRVPDTEPDVEGSSFAS